MNADQRKDSKTYVAYHNKGFKFICVHLSRRQRRLQWTVSAAGCAFAFACAATANAQQYPAKPIKVGEGFAVGGPSALPPGLPAPTGSRGAAAPARHGMPRTSNRQDSPPRAGPLNSPPANASIAIPPARNASDVLIQARNVRSWARVKRGSGSVPPGKSLRASQPRGIGVASDEGSGSGGTFLV